MNGGALVLTNAPRVGLTLMVGHVIQIKLVSAAHYLKGVFFELSDP
jgi:hypothetical protein